jgi:hypothetical protein
MEECRRFPPIKGIPSKAIFSARTDLLECLLSWMNLTLSIMMGGLETWISIDTPRTLA